MSHPSETTEPRPAGSEEELRGLAIRGARWSVLDKWGVRLLNLATFSVLAYLLDPVAFGVVASAQVVMGLVQTVTQQGVAQALIVDRQDSSDVRSTAFWLSTASGCLGAGLLFAAAPLVAALFDVDELTGVVRVLSCYLVLRGLGAVPEALAQRAMRFNVIAARSIGAAVTSSAVGITLAVLGFGVWALVAQLLSQAAISTLLLWVATRFRPRFTFSRVAAARVLRFGWKVACIDALTVVVGQGDNFVVGVLLGPEALGYYVIAFRILNVLVDAFTGVMAALALPVFARLRDDRRRTVSALVHATRVSLAITVPLFGALLVAAPFVVPLMFGPQWEQSAAMLQVLCLPGILSSITFFDRGVLLAADRADLEVGVVAVMAVGTVVAAVIGAQFSVFAVAVAVAIRMFLTVPLRILALRAAIGLDWRVYLRGWITPCLGAVALFAVAGAVAVLGAGRMGSAWLVVAAGAGLLAYAACMWVIDRPLVRELAGFLRPA